MHSLTNMRINIHHPPPKIRILINQHLRIKSHGHKERRNPALDRHQEDITDLQSNEESKSHDDSGKGVVGVVGGSGEGEIEVSEERTDVGDEDGSHC